MTLKSKPTDVFLLKISILRSKGASGSGNIIQSKELFSKTAKQYIYQRNLR
ncbi:hypothetical protein Syun_023036 [Stephania yunnanensis]|uniref:Uncharacterized protein n=1 Tax=Stephania yunnanensis TaxID=152371 RepID=A0AAP0I378_9MAGN